MQRLHLRAWIVQHWLFFRILLYFLALLIPIVIIGFLVYMNVGQLIRNDVSGKLTENLLSSSKTIDLYINMVQSTNNNLLLSDTIQQDLRPSDILTDHEKLAMPSIVKAIAANQNTINTFIDSIFLYIDDQRVYTGNGVASFDAYFDELYTLSAYSKEFWRAKLKTDGFFELLPPTRVTNTFTNTIRNVIPSTSTQYLNGTPATIVTTISIPAIEAALKGNSIYPSTAYEVVDGHGQLVLASDGLSDADNHLLQNLLAPGPGAQSKTMRINGRLGVAVHVRSDSFGWDYYSVTPLRAFNQEPTSILRLILWICVSLIVIGILISLMFSMNLYNPIKNIRDILLQNELEQKERTGEDRGRHRSGPGSELQLLGSRVHRLMEEKRAAASQIDRVTEELLEQFFMDALDGRQTQPSERISRILQEFGISMGPYVCVCFLFRFRERYYREIEEADRMRIQGKLKNVLWGILQHDVNGYLIEYERNLFVFSADLGSGNDRARLEQGLEQVRYTFDYDMVYCDLVIGIGKVYEEWSGISRSFGDALTAIDRHTPGTPVPAIDAAQLSIDQMYYYSFLDENKLVNGLKSGDMDIVRREVERLLQANREREVSYPLLGSLMAELFHTGCRYITEKGFSVQDFATDAEYAALSASTLMPHEYEERLLLLYRFYERIVAETVVKPERKSAAVVALIANYMENNYDQDLYLERISEEIGLSAKYISRLFKETTGTSITDYLSLIRLAKAKELLLETDLKVAEIADRIGIFSRTTFLRLFKKYEGVSPQDFRNVHRHDRSRKT